jgi:hypothetical protein
MGAEQFETIGIGASVNEAFVAAVDDAHHWYGHAGYTGTVCEKPGFVEFPVPKGFTAADVVKALEVSWRDQKPLQAIYGDANTVSRIASLYDDKWEAAVALRVDATTWVFCGWASC